MLFRRNTVPPIQPVSQINPSAPFTAKWKKPILLLTLLKKSFFSADWTNRLIHSFLLSGLPSEDRPPLLRT